MKKKIIVTVLFAMLIQVFAFSQRSKKVPNLRYFDNHAYHFGFLIAVNKMHFSIKPVEDYTNIVFTSTMIPDDVVDSARVLNMNPVAFWGFTVGIISNLRLRKYFDLRFMPTLSLGERRIEYDMEYYKGGNTIKPTKNKNISSSYVEFPLHIKYKGKRLQNARPYITGGVKPAFDLASLFGTKDDIDIVTIKLKRFDVSLELGAGFDFYFSWFKMGAEAKMSYSLKDMLVKEDNLYVMVIEKMNSKVFQFSLTFE